uniref:hypothetical protein n=1 Tax=Paraprevotella clara TaxID=454154 RepID=UPI003FED7466
MKSFKLWQLPGFILCLLLGLVFFSSCDKDDDETGGGGVIGYWLPLDDNYAPPQQTAPQPQC